MKNIMMIVFLSLVIGSTAAAENIRIGPYGDYPIAYGSLKDIIDGKKFMIPNGTKAVVLKWNTNYSKLKGPFARLDMNERSQVKILNGPLRGKILFIAHVHINIL